MTTTRMTEMYIVAPSYSAADESRFPDVPVPPSVNLAALMEARRDTSPVFVIRPLAILDEVSDNGLPYNQAICDDVFTQVNAYPRPARQGHVPAAEKSSSFPPDDGYWIGAVWNSTVYGKPAVFGKCYVVPGETRDMVLSRQAIGTPLSNSLWGDVIWDGNEPVGVNIESIDFVPQERAALQALGGDFKVTSEMREESMTDENAGNPAAAPSHLEAFKSACGNVSNEELTSALNEMGKAHHVAELHMKAGGCAECTDTAMHEMLSESVRQRVAETYAQERNMMLKPKEDAAPTSENLAEMATLKAQLAEMATMKKELSELRAANQRHERKDFEAAVDEAINADFSDWHIRTEKGNETLKTLKGELRFRAMAEMAGMTGGQTMDNIGKAIELASPHIRPLKEMALANLAGPSAFVGTVSSSNASAQQTQHGYDPKTGRYSTEGAAAARAKANW